MSIRFIIGRAGTGKTFHCLDAMRKQLAESPANGPPLILLTPEQASLQMERALLSQGVGATCRAQVLSFKRLSLRILQQAGCPERTALSVQARAMVLRTIIARLQPQLQYYRKIERLTGLVERLGSTIGEMIDEAVSPADLRETLEQASANSPRCAKIADLAAIFEGYLAYLGNELLDPSQYLQIAREQLAKSDIMNGVRIWVDGFAGFTRQEMLLLVDLAARSEQTDITLLIDPDYHRSVKDSSEADASDLFAKSQRTCLRLKQMFVDLGIDIAPPVYLEPSSPPRFLPESDLARLEQNLAIPATTQQTSEEEPSTVYIREVPNRRTEVELAVSEICSLVRSSNEEIRYRDVAVIVRDLAPYHDLLTAALTERNIPFFIDRRRPTNHHPLVEFIRAAVAAAIVPYATDAIRMLLKTGVLPLAVEAADELENYILAHGITGSELWTGDDWTYSKDSRVGSSAAKREQEQLIRVNASRRSIVEAIDDFVTFASTPATGAEWADALRQLLDHNRVGDQLDQWTTDAEADGDVDLAEQHRRIVHDVAAFLDDIEDALGSQRLRVAELSGVIDAGLSQLTLGLVPPTVDQVLVGSIERSRHPDLKAVIILGFNDGVFPLLGSEDTILNDEDRQALSADGVDIGVTRQQRILDEAMLIYIAVTRPSRRLTITYATADADGKALRPSPFIKTLKEALPNLKEQFLGDPFRTRQTWPLLTARDLATHLAAEMRDRPPLTDDNSDKRLLWNSLYDKARQASTLIPIIRRPIAALNYFNRASLSPDTVSLLIRKTFEASVSELETYAACPFKRFGQYGLRLRKRTMADLEATDVGTVHHAILEQYIKSLLQDKADFASVSDSDILPALKKCAEQIGTELGREGETSTARDAYVLARSSRDLSPVVAGQKRISAAGKFRPHKAELKFGFNEPDSLSPLEISTPSGRRVLLRGLIDRVDLAEVGDELLGVVIDYKRTVRDKRLVLSDVMHGLNLQLLGYLLVLAERGETLAGRPIIPVGAFYISLMQKYESVKHPDEKADKDVSTGSNPRGILREDRILDLDQEYEGTGSSNWFSLFRKKDGQLGRIDTTDATTRDQFHSLLTYTKQKMGELADGILDGNVSVSPYRLGDFSPCQWCDLRPVCQFEFDTDSELRFLDKPTRKEVLSQLSEEG